MILVFIEEREGKIKKSSLEVLSEAARRAEDLKTEVKAVIVGHQLENLASDTFLYGASQVYVLENPLLSFYSASGYAHALLSLIGETKADLILFSASSLPLM